MLVVTYGVVAVVVPVRSTVPPLATYAGASTVAYAADLVAGLSLLCAGLLSWAEPRTRRLGVLALLAGIAWFAPDWEGWDLGPALVRSLGAVATPISAALLAHLVLSFPTGRLPSRLARVLVLAAYGAAVLVSLGRALVRDPLLDLYCWRNCLDNSFLVHADPGLAGALDELWIGSLLAIGVSLVAVVAWRLASASGPTRRVLWPGLVPGMFLGAVEVTYAIALVRTRLENPESSEFASIFLALALSVAALAAGMAWSVVRARRTRAAVSQLARQLGEAPLPGTFRDALAAAVGDRSLEVAYWLPGSQRFVDGNGRTTVPPGASPGRAVAAIVREGQLVAMVGHDAALLDGMGLEREIGAAARLAVENERLQAEVLAQLEDLRASRARIVERADAERRRLERNLHDGAQQRLLALSYELRLANAAAEQDGDRELVATLASVAGETQAALDELRELAHGIYPAILAEAGLAPALTTLADEAALPVEIGAIPEERYETRVATAAYLAVAEAIEDAVERKATFVAVQLRRDGERLVVTVRDDGRARSSGLVRLSDRIGALGGSLDLWATALHAEIPCG